MKDVFKKVLLSICIYLFLIIVISSYSYLYRYNQNLISLSNRGKLTKEEIYKDIIEQQQNTQSEEQATTETVALPFSFDVNIDEELTTEPEVAFIYHQVLSTESMDITSDMLIELEKRKIKIKYKRIFILYIFKQQIKRVTPNKWRIKEDKLCL
jgi:hypothetical protein